MVGIVLPAVSCLRQDGEVMGGTGFVRALGCDTGLLQREWGNRT